MTTLKWFRNGRPKMRKTRPISWVKAALKEFDKFSVQARVDCTAALTIAAEGGKAEIANPLHGLGSGVLEIVLPYREDAYRLVNALQIEEAIWVVHAF